MKVHFHPPISRPTACPCDHPKDDDYDRARTIIYGGFDRQPAVIIQACNAADVVRTILLARETGMELAVRSGGHNLSGHGLSDGGIVLDLRNLKTMDIDPVKRTAWAGTGLTAREYNTAAAAHNLATGFGDTGSVGIGGVTIGGGVGFLVRKYGLIIDNLLAAKMVIDDGRSLRVDAENHPDLFWAIRGGGGNFGVATRFLFRLEEVGPVLGGMLILPATVDAITNLIATVEAAPEELSMVANIMPAPPMPFLQPEVHGRLVIMAMMLYAGPVDEGQRAVAPFRAIATPLADLLRPMSYPEAFPPEVEDFHTTVVSNTLFVDSVDRNAAKAVMDYLEASTAPIRVAQFRVLGGAAARVPVEATAFAHRQARIMSNIVSFYKNPEDREAQASWVENFSAALPRQDSSAFVSFLSGDDSRRIADAYPGPTLERLKAVKALYDPTNLFHLNQNIRPL